MPTDPKNVPNSQYYVDNKAPEPTGDSFFYQPSEIDSSRWNQAFPYQLIFVKLVKNDASNSDKSTSIEFNTYETTQFRFTLPIPPQDLSIGMPMATSVQATLGGIVEQHGGAPFRDIIISGTTGITPVKNSAGPRDPNNQSLVGRTAGAIFAGSAEAARSFASNAQIVGQGTNTFLTNVNDGLGDGGGQIPTKSTGYYQFRLLERFLESYQEIKKKSGEKNDLIGFDPKDLRLAFAIWKDEACYLCSGVNFMLKRNVANPMEYMYTLQLKAWKRVKLDKGEGVLNAKHKFVARAPNLYAQVLTRWTAANATLRNANDFFKSVVQDPIDRLGEITREVSLSLKLTVGTAININDLPDSIKSDVAFAAYKNWNKIVRSIPSLPPVAPSILLEGMGKALSHSSTNAGKAGPPSGRAVSSLSPSTVTTKAKLTEYFDLIKPTDVPLPSTVQKAIQAEKDRASKLSRHDYEKARDDIRKLSADFADAIGAGGATYNLIYNRPAPSFSKTPTSDEYDILFALNELALMLDHMAASGTVNQPTLNSLEYVAGLAQGSGIAFTVPTAKMAVPMPYGVTLERLAVLYLNDANRWNEIATLNGLRAPYIDEQGFSLPFITNGSDRKLYVSDKTNLYVNQQVWISSNTQPKSKRRITGIREIYSGYVEISVDGNSDLASFTTASQSILEAFLPGTVNSQQVIYIPSSGIAPEDPKTKSIPGVDEFDPMLQVSGVDLLLTHTGDLAITPDGDCRLAYGLQNIIQTVKLALSTSYGSLINHPSYGLKVQVGESTADVTAEDIVKSAVALFDGDPTFTKVASATVVKDGPSVTITIVVGVAGISQLVPITFTLVK